MIQGAAKFFKFCYPDTIAPFKHLGLVKILFVCIKEIIIFIQQ